MTHTILSLGGRSPRRALLAALLLVGALSLSAGWILDGHAATDQTDHQAIASAAETGKAFTAVTRQVAPAVVYIKSTRQHVMTGHEPGLDGLRGQIPDELLRQFFGDRLPEFPLPRQPQPQVPILGVVGTRVEAASRQ